jgi:DNA-binding MarR family transcriptional regulator
MISCYCSILRAATRKVSSIYDEALSPLGINVAQFSLLRAVDRLQPVSLTDLAKAAQLERSTIGRNIQVLERMRLLEIRRGDIDHREAIVTLTVVGGDVLSKAGPLWEECQKTMEARLGPVKITALQDILRSI